MAWTFLRVYFDQEKAWEALSDAERGRLLLAALQYAAREQPPQFRGNERYQWPQIQIQIDKERQAYRDKVSQCSEAGKASAASRNSNSTTVNDRQRPFIKDQEQEQKQEDLPAGSGEPSCSADAQRVVDAWNSLGLTQVKKLIPNTNRASLLNSRLRQYGLDDVLAAIENIRNSPFLNGDNNRGWQITFDWFVKPNNFSKVFDGNYNAQDQKKIDDNKPDLRWFYNE